MSEPTGRPDEPETTVLPIGEPTAEWAVASTGHPPAPPRTQPLGSDVTGGTGEPVAVGAVAGAAAAGVSGGLPGTPVDPAAPGGAGAPGADHAPWHSGTPEPGAGVAGGVLPPRPEGWGPQEDVLANGPQGAARRRFPLGLAAAGGAVLIAGAAFAAGMAVGHHEDRLQNTSAGAPFGAPGQGGQGGQLGQGQRGQGQQGQGQQGGQLGGGPNRGQLPSGIGQLVAAGVITEVNGSTLTVQGRNGLVTVRTSDSTLVEDDLGGSVSALQAGELIFVAGKVADDGSVTAMAIADRPFFAGIPGNRGQNGSDDTGRNGSDGQDTSNRDQGGVTT